MKRVRVHHLAAILNERTTKVIGLTCKMCIHATGQCLIVDDRNGITEVIRWLRY